VSCSSDSPIGFNDLRPGQIVVIDVDGDPNDPDNAGLVLTTVSGNAAHSDGGSPTALSHQ
jgi:hypothetical protein